MKTSNYIEGTEKVTDVLGYWPCFHDAEVISFSAVREPPPEMTGYTLARLAVHYEEFATVGEGTVDYDTVTTKSVIIRFLFHGACDFQITDFNQQNVINSIDVSQVEADDAASLLVEVESIWGFGGTLRCESIEIEAVEVLPI